jgi:SAM-dependent methyltransferase
MDRKAPSLSVYLCCAQAKTHRLSAPMLGLSRVHAPRGACGLPDQVPRSHSPPSARCATSSGAGGAASIKRRAEDDEVGRTAKLSNSRGGFYKRDFWIRENTRFSQPYFRLEKLGRIVNSIANGRTCDLLDIGCGPATLAKLLRKNINYFGIDIAIQDPAPNLLEVDILENEIKFGDIKFDIVVAAGLFEYMADSQHQKFCEIKNILKDGGKFIVTYSNVRRYRQSIPATWNNIQPIEDFKNDLGVHFHVDRFFASSHSRKGPPSNRRVIRNIQMNLNIYIPLISPLLALDYIMVCSNKD